MTGRHRSPPTAPRTDWRWHTIAALAGLGILAPPVTLWAEAVAPDASGAARVSTVTRAQRTTAGPLMLPSIGVVAPAVASLYPTTENALSRPRSVPRVSLHAPAPATTAAGLSEAAQPIETTSDTPAATTTPEPTPAAPPTDPIAAADSATPTSEEQPVSETPVSDEVVTVVEVP